MTKQDFIDAMNRHRRNVLALAHDAKLAGNPELVQQYYAAAAAYEVAIYYAQDLTTID